MVLQKICIFLLLCSCSPFMYASESSLPGSESNRLVIASSNNFPPINMLDESGKLTGFAAELADAVASELGYEVEHIHSSSWINVLSWLDEGRADLIHDTGYTVEREDYLDFSAPIIEMPEVIFVRNEQLAINSFNSLRGKNVACVKQHITHIYLKEFSDINCYLVNTPAEGLIALVNGNVDAFIYPQQITLYLAQQLLLERKIKVVGDPLRELSWSMTVKHGNSALLEDLNRGIAAVRASGEYQKIYDRWFGKHFFVGYSEREVILIVGATVTVALLLFISLGLLFHVHRVKRANVALEESEGKYRTLADKVPASIFFKDLDSTYISCNQRYAESLGIRAKDIAGKNDYDFHPENAEAYQSGDKKVIDSGETDEFIESYIENGKNICVNTIKTLVYDQNGKPLGVLGIFWDITEKQQLQQQLLQSQKMEAIGQLTGGIAHDFNNILSSILGFSELSLLHLQKGADVNKIKSCLDEVVNSSNRARDLVQQMLAYARTNKGELKDVKITELFENISTMLRPMLTSSVELTLDIGDSELTVKADRIALEQVLINLCVNARDAMNARGKIVIGAQVMHKDEERCTSCHQLFHGDYVALSVTDSGEGITEEMKNKIFEPFVTTKEVGKGSGMGLSMVHGIVHDHLGHIVVLSNPRGTTFNIYLPN